jgi:hypothetical protein
MKTTWIAAPVLVALWGCGPSRTEATDPATQPDDGFGARGNPAGVSDPRDSHDGHDASTPGDGGPIVARPQDEVAIDTSGRMDAPSKLPGTVPTTQPVPPGSVAPPGGAVPMSPGAGGSTAAGGVR